jgi:hypothetical protein
MANVKQKSLILGKKKYQRGQKNKENVITETVIIKCKKGKRISREK